MSRRIVSFIDLLGTKESSKVSEDQFFPAIEFLHEALELHTNILEGDYEIRGFSDCAFMAFVADPSTYRFFNAVRSRLFSRGFYFKCSILFGEIEFEVKGSSSEPFSRVTLGPESVNAYLLHESFKGIGFCVDKSLDKPSLLRKYMVPSIYIEDDKGANLKQSWDIRFNEGYTGNSKYVEERREGRLVEGEDNHSAELNLNRYIKSLLIAKTKNQRYSKYYIPSLISIVNSSNFSKVAFVEDEGWKGAPLMFHKLFIDGVFRRRLSSVPASEVLYCAAINKIYQDCSSGARETGEVGEVKNRLARAVHGLPKVKKAIGAMPSYVLKPAYKGDFIERLAVAELAHG